MPGGKSACGAMDAGEAFEEIGDDGGEGCVPLGGPDAGLAVGLLGDSYGDVLRHGRFSGIGRAEMPALSASFHCAPGRKNDLQIGLGLFYAAGQ